jgi:hypothetical protein
VTSVENTEKCFKTLTSRTKDGEGKWKWKIMNFLLTCSICVPIFALQVPMQHSNSSYVCLNRLALAMACEIPSRRDCGNRGWYTFPFFVPIRGSRMKWGPQIQWPNEEALPLISRILHLRRHLSLIVIGAPLAADTLQLILSKRSEFPGCSG